jgi:hypothetical protein
VTVYRLNDGATESGRYRPMWAFVKISLPQPTGYTKLQSRVQHSNGEIRLPSNRQATDVNTWTRVEPSKKFILSMPLAAGRKEHLNHRRAGYIFSTVKNT